MTNLLETIESSISETVAEWYETELKLAFQYTTATIHMGAETGGGCTANVVENIGSSGLDIVITQGSEAPYLASGGIEVSLCPDFFYDLEGNSIQEVTYKVFHTHESAIEYVKNLRDMALAIAKLDLRQSAQTDFIKVHIPKNDCVFNHPENQTAVIGIDCPPYGHNRILEIFLDESEADAFINNGGKNA